MISGEVIIAVFLLAGYGLSVGYILFHALSTGRSPVIWPIVAMILPFVGALLYVLYVVIQDEAVKRNEMRRRMEHRGEHIYKFRSFTDRMRFEGISALMSFRDKEVEGILFDGCPSDAEALIDRRKKQAVGKGDTIAVESYDYYVRVLDQIYRDGTVPDELAEVWEKEGRKREYEEISDEEYQDRYLTNVKRFEIPEQAMMDFEEEGQQPSDIPVQGENPGLET